jgi:hypothetical protein
MKQPTEAMHVLVRVFIAAEGKTDCDVYPTMLVDALAEEPEKFMEHWEEYCGVLEFFGLLWAGGLIVCDNDKRAIRLTEEGVEQSLIFAKNFREYVDAHPELLADAVSEETH